MTLQFDRSVEVQVDTIIITKLDVAFRVTKTLKKEPNTCELTIYNLNKEHRDQLAQIEAPVVKIKASYKGRGSAGTAALAAVDSLLGNSNSTEAGLIFLGDVRDVSSRFDPPDWVTTLESGDGEKKKRGSRINKSFAKGTSLKTVMGEAAKALGVGLGNIDKKALSAKLLGAGGEFLNGVTLSGPASKELDRVIKSAGLEWSVQDGVLQILEPGKPLEDISVVLSSSTGLIGSPTIGNDGVVRMTALINSDIVPGRQLELDSATIKARCRAERCEYTGTNYDMDFYVNIEAKEL